MIDAAILDRIPSLEELDVRQKRSLAMVLSDTSYLPEETIFEQGDKAWSCYLIVEGSVEVELGGEKKSKRVATLGPGELFGEVALVDRGRRSATCHAGPEGAHLAELKRPEFDLIFEAGNSFAYRLMDLIAAQLVRRLRQSSAQLRQAAIEEG